MTCAQEILRRGEWNGPAADTVLLDYDGRQRRRIALTGIGGTAFLLDLERVMGLQDGDALRLTDGSLVQVKAAPEALYEVRCQDRLHLIRVAWHLGNRHLPTQIEEDRLLIREDRVIAEMLNKLSADVTLIEAPFLPEGGAYGLGTTLSHSHNHSGHHHHENGHSHG